MYIYNIYYKYVYYIYIYVYYKYVHIPSFQSMIITASFQCLSSCVSIPFRQWGMTGNDAM